MPVFVESSYFLHTTTAIDTQFLDSSGFCVCTFVAPKILKIIVFVVFKISL